MKIIKSILLLAASVISSPLFAGETLYYYHNDHLGTPQMMTNQSQTVVWQADYKPFGEVAIITATIENNLRFPGQYYDAESGLHYNYFRDYDPGLGRYVQSDPIGLEGGLQTYSYAYQNPTNYFDPFGLDVIMPGGGTIRKDSNGMHYHDKNNSGQFECGEGNSPNMPYDENFLDFLDKLDRAYPEKDIEITSGRRTPDRQEKIRKGSGYGTDGEKISDHVTGTGADVYVRGVSATAVADKAKSLGASGTRPYGGHTHVDTNSARQWHKRTKVLPNSQ